MRIRLTNKSREKVHDATLALGMAPGVITWDGKVFVFSHVEVLEAVKFRVYREASVQNLSE